MIYNKMMPRDFLDELFLNQQRIIHSKIELLDWKENSIGEIQGKATGGSVSIDGSSAIRRTASLTMNVDENNYNITSMKNELSFNKKIKLYAGLDNTSLHHQEYGDVIWFPLGVFVLTEASVAHGIDGVTINLSAQDKMCLLSGDVAGELQATTADLRKVTEIIDGKAVEREILLYELLQLAITTIGGEDPAKVIISDVPLEYKVPLKYIGNINKYYDAHDNELTDVVDPATDSRISRVIKPGQFAGYRMQNLTYPKEMIKTAGSSIVSIIEDIKNVLGNYEYFYDVEGNFVFQEVKNYTNTTFTPIQELNDGHYVADFTKTPWSYSFKEKHIINSYSNAPDWKNIKNDFVVWGVRQNGAGVDGAQIQFHLAIDDKPDLPSNYKKPWQQYLVEHGDANPTAPGTYYGELKPKLPQVYDSTTNKWNEDSSVYNYYFDMIDSNTELGKYSVSTIGRRTKAIVDENVSVMYPPVIPDIVILPTSMDLEYIGHLINTSQRFMIVSDTEYEKLYTPGGVGKDAFTVIRDMLWRYTSFNEVISMNLLPLYFLEVNTRIEVEDQRSNIYGDYIIKSMSIPLNPEGLSAISAIRVTPRI